MTRVTFTVTRTPASRFLNFYPFTHHTAKIVQFPIMFVINIPVLMWSTYYNRVKPWRVSPYLPQLLSRQELNVPNCPGHFILQMTIYASTKMSLLYTYFLVGNFLTRGSVATKFHKNEAESCLKISESCLLSCKSRLRVAYISEISWGLNMSKKIGIFFRIFRMESRKCVFDFWFLFCFSAILREIWKNQKNTSSVLHSKLDLSCFALLFWGSKSCLQFLIWGSKVACELLEFSENRGWKPQKKSCQQKKVYYLI